MSTDFLNRFKASPDANVEPIDVEVNVEKAEIRIVWSDQHQSVYPFIQLRKACPCAECREVQRQNQMQKGGLRILSGSVATAQNLQLVDLFPVGRYAFGMHWSDGHQTGIYPFDLLRSLCSCPACQQKAKEGKSQA
jgi:DUF971 family protein